MAKEINNMDDLAIALQPVMKKMVDNMANRVYETLNFFLQRYYDSYDPIYYRRQYDFLRSGFKVDGLLGTYCPPKVSPIWCPKRVKEKTDE